MVYWSGLKLVNLKEEIYMSINREMLRFLSIGIFCLTTGGSTYAAVKADIVVAQDGSGTYKKVQEAVAAAKSGQTILVKAGTYKEQVNVSAAKIRIVGESYEKTIITFNLYPNSPGKASMTVSGDEFYAEQITIQNTIDSRVEGAQAEALRVSGDKAVFYKCKITGFQDTYCHVNGKRSYHKDCIIEGTTDFIYGDGIALFENCTINNRKDSHVTAAKPGSKRDYGYVFRNCEIRRHPSETVTNASLGRPWGDNANVVYLECYIGEHIRPDGWMVWNGRETHKTAYYAEYKSFGPGAQPEKRLSWTHQLTDTEAAKYTKEKVLAGWNPVIEGATGIQTQKQAALQPASYQTLSITPDLNTFTFRVSQTADVKLSLLDLHGREIMILKNGTVSTGSHSVSLNRSNLAAGVYIPRLIVNVENEEKITVHTHRTIRLY
jgi:pectinesterase